MRIRIIIFPTLVLTMKQILCFQSHNQPVVQERLGNRRIQGIPCIVDTQFSIITRLVSVFQSSLPIMGQYPGILQIQIERRTISIIVADVFAGIKELIDQTYRIVKMP